MGARLAYAIKNDLNPTAGGGWNDAAPCPGRDDVATPQASISRCGMLNQPAHRRERFSRWVRPARVGPCFSIDQ
jgi:hypothetical protein